MAVDILKRLKFDNDTIDKVQKYVRYHDDKPQPDARSVRRAVNRIGEAYFGQVMEIRRADTLAQSGYQREQKLAQIDEVLRLYDQIMEKKQCISLKTLAVTGNDLIALGVPRGRRIGEILNCLLDDVLQNPEDNVHEYLIERAKKLL